jgi:hypothetical protein
VFGHEEYDTIDFCFFQDKRDIKRT